MTESDKVVRVMALINREIQDLDTVQSVDFYVRIATECQQWVKLITESVMRQERMS